jgi:hypothetical protein
VQPFDRRIAALVLSKLAAGPVPSYWVAEDPNPIKSIVLSFSSSKITFPAVAFSDNVLI